MPTKPHASDAQTDEQLQRMLATLRQAIRRSGMTQAQVQTELGWGKSYLSQMLNGTTRLRVGDVLKILGVIDVPPEDFFAKVFTASDDSPGDDDAESRGER